MQPSEVKWSFSSLKDYINCPRQYHELKVLKRYEKRPTEQMLYGSAVHKALEDYVGDGKPLPDDYKRYAPQLDPLKDMPGDKYPEKRMAVGFDRTPSKWTEYWARGIVDLLVVDEDTGFIVDYKTGNDKYADLKQLQLMALLSFATFHSLNGLNLDCYLLLKITLFKQNIYAKIRMHYGLTSYRILNAYACLLPMMNGNLTQHPYAVGVQYCLVSFIKKGNRETRINRLCLSYDDS